VTSFDTESNRAEFVKRTADRDAKWLEELLGERPVRWYVTTRETPSQQLKNKLSQASTMGGGLLVLSVSSVEVLEKARTALVERWGHNPEWPKGVACVALADANGIRAVVVWKKSPFPELLRDRFGDDIEIVEAQRPREADAVDTHGDPAKLAELLCISRNHVDDWLWLIEKQRAVIFYGPPGTGKTYIARRLAEYLQPRPELRRLVQLHPSYGYEEFFEGYRPAPTEGGVGGGLRLAKQDGPLRDLARLAELEPQAAAVMVLDEVNRGNLPRVFGELYFLIEYRDAEVSLMYSPDDRFRLPKNLSFIGTMNTADRSVAVLDQALRRRFYFVPLFPGEPPVDGMLRRFLERNRPDMAYVADLLDLANRNLPRHSRIGPSHLMRLDLDEEVLDRVWRFSVLPSIAEQFFEREDELEATLSLHALRAQLARREG
jgi:5-methylcytosine-specific restriction protein B